MWKQVLTEAEDEYHILEDYLTPGRKAGSGHVSKKEFQNYVNQTNLKLNILKIKPASTSNESNNNNI